MSTLKIVGLTLLVFFIVKELFNAYEQIGVDVIFIIIPLGLIVAVFLYFRKRNRPPGDEDLTQH